jgi:NADPH-dependent curcumin reductase CurA
MQVVRSQITMTGFGVISLAHKYDEQFYNEVPPKLASEEIKYSEDITEGLDKVGDVMLAVLEGRNKAKAVIQVAKE